jgi:DNA-binding CsgD family transcriptional regulator
MKFKLTPREQQIAIRFLKFDTRKEIARRLSISLSTVDFHVRNLRIKVVASCREELAVKLSQLNGAISGKH